jgi:hypothetical protein
LRRGFAIGLPWLAVLCITCAAADDQRPIEESFITEDGQPPPRTVQEMVDFADAVVVAQHTGATEVRQGTSVAGYTPVSTSHTFRLTEIVKFNAALPAVGATFPVVTRGGDRDRGTHVERSRLADTEPMNLQGTYVVFLNWKPERNTLQLLWSHAGLLEITSGFVKSGSLGAARHNGKPADEFVAELHRAASN